MQNDLELAIIVSSCDTYDDAWVPFFTLFFRYWPDCPYPIYLVTETKKYSDKRITPITIQNSSWATRLKEVMRTLPQKYVLYLQEDYFLKSHVDSKRIQELFEILRKEDVTSLRLYPVPAPQISYKGYEGVGEVRRGTPYRLSLQATMWNKDFFQELLLEGGDPWNTEHGGSIRSNDLRQPFLSVFPNSVWSRNVSPCFEYVCTGIVKRKWIWDAIYLFRKEGISIDVVSRGIESYGAYIRRRLRQLPYIGEWFRLLYVLGYMILSLYRRLLDFSSK